MKPTSSPYMAIRCLAVLTCLFFAGNIRAYNLRQFSNMDGLSNSAVLSLCQDKEGFLWLGTYDGLNLYDGLDIRPLTFAEGNGLSGNIVENIIETDAGILWIQTNYGLDRLDKYHRSVTNYTQFQGSYILKKSPKNDVFVLSAENDMLYYITARSDHFEELPIPGLDTGEVVDICIGNDFLWTFTRRGIIKYRLEEKNGRYTAKEKVVVDDMPLSHCFTDGEVSYMTDQQYTLYKYEREQNRKVVLAHLDKEMHKRGILADILCHDNALFIAFKTNGVLKLTPQSEGYKTEDIGIRSGIFRLLKGHSQDIVWIGTDGEGAYLYSNGNYSIQSVTYKDLNINIAKPMRAIFLDRESALWLGTKGAGILKIEEYDPQCDIRNCRKELITTGNSQLLDNSVYAFAPSSRPLFWIGSDEGINYYSYTEKRIRRIPCPESLQYVHAIYEEHDSVLWIATVGTGIVRARIEGPADAPRLANLRRYTIDKGNISSNYFFTLHCDGQGQLLFGNRGYGTFRIENGELKPLPLKNSYPDKTANDVFAILKDSDALWLGTGYGLIRQGESEQCFTKEDGLLNSSVHAMLKDNSNNIWLSTNKGLARFHTNRNEIQNYNWQNGLNIFEFSDGAALKHDDMLFFGGINGLAVIRENSHYRTDEYTPPIRFTRLSILGKEQNLYEYMQPDGNDRQRLVLNYTQNYFSISFLAMDYISPNNYAYLYKVDKKGSEWIDNGESNTVSFTQMSPGDYTLYVKYRNRTTGKESGVYSIDIRIQPPWYLSNAAVFFYQLLTLAALFILVRTYMKRQKQKQRQMLTQLEQAHKEEVYEEKLRFFTNITHEFCTPLTLIYGPCERILAHDSTDAFTRKYVRLIKQNAERLNALIQEVIDFRRMETGHKVRTVKQLPVSDLCNETIGSFADLAEQNRITLENHIEEGLCWNSDPDCFTKILGNLISNAFKYTPTDGTIRIALKIEEKQLRLAIYNTGKGIRKEDRERIFNRYSILDNIEENSVKGLSSRNGLGMAICHSMVELLEGRIEIESETGRYAEFIVTLPDLPLTQPAEQEGSPEAIPEEAPAQQPAASPAATPLPAPDCDEVAEKEEENPDKRQILVVDDNAEMLMLLQDTLSERYKVAVAHDGQEGLEMVRKTSPELIITDVMMPGTDGMELTRQIKQDKHTMHIPLIILSAKNANEEKIEGLESGADAYIGKPFDLDYLKAVAARLIANKEKMKEYYNTPACAYEFANGQLMEKKDKEFLEAVTAYIAANLENAALTPDDLAGHLQISIRSLYRKFKELNQPSPKDFIKEYRIVQAAKLLRTTTQTVQEILYQCGFNNRSHFYKEFDKKFQTTPKEYRTQAGSGKGTEKG